MVGTGKLAGILVETRWRERQVDWVAIGWASTCSVPTVRRARRHFGEGTSRLEVLAELVPALRAAAGRVARSRRRSSRSGRARHAAGRCADHRSAVAFAGWLPMGRSSSSGADGTALARAGSLVLAGRRGLRNGWRVTFRRAAGSSSSRIRVDDLVFDVGNTETTIGLFDGDDAARALAHHDRTSCAPPTSTACC